LEVVAEFSSDPPKSLHPFHYPLFAAHRHELSTSGTVEGVVEEVVMNLNVEISDALAPALKAKADERGVSASSYARQVLERDLSKVETQARPNEAPIWEVVTDIMKNVPDEVFDRLPKDAASQVDHYVYGLPKRSS
jgi:hypothetical protein